MKLAIVRSFAAVFVLVAQASAKGDHFGCLLSSTPNVDEEKEGGSIRSVSSAAAAPKQCVCQEGLCAQQACETAGGSWSEKCDARRCLFCADSASATVDGRRLQDDEDDEEKEEVRSEPAFIIISHRLPLTLLFQVM